MSKDTLRMVIGFAIVMAILLVWQTAFRPRPVRAPTPEPATTNDTVEAEKSAPTPAPTDPAHVSPPAATLTRGLTATAARAETTLVLENEHLRLEFSNLGGTLRSAWLKQYKAELVPAGTGLFGSELVTGRGLVDLSGTPLSTAGDARSVTFRIASDSLSLTKTFELGDGYTLEQRVEFGGASGYRLNALAGLATTERNVKEDLSHFHFYARSRGKVLRLAVKDLKNPKSIGQPADWVGLKSKYFFLAAFSPDQGFDSSRAVGLGDGRIGFSVAASPSSSVELDIYIGPLEYNRLRSFGLGFEEAVSLGWAKPVALAILWLLRFLNRVFGNWGIAIIVFSIIMKAIFYPLTRTQTRQMRQMQMLQPKLNELKQKHKDNPQVLNQETMQLYRLYKINPLSGCLPLLVQLPVFWALYAVLRAFIELRGAGFVLWITDLSEPDTLFGHLPFFGNPAFGLLPVLMGVSFIAQNLLTSTDKKNWALTIIFPIFITAIFLNFPSGLQLYWFMYNILSILESIIGIKGGKSWRKPRLRKEQTLAAAKTS